MKNGSKVFTVPQKEEAMEVLVTRSVEKNVESFQVINKDHIEKTNKLINLEAEVLNTNAALAVQLVEAWCKTCGKKINLLILFITFVLFIP